MASDGPNKPGWKPQRRFGFEDIQADLAWAIDAKEAYFAAKRDGNDRNLGEDDEAGRGKGKGNGKAKK